MTLKELQKIAGGTEKKNEPSNVMKQIMSLEELRQNVGIFSEDGNNAERRREPLEKIQQQVARGYISAYADIRMIFKHTLWRPLDNIEACVSDSIGAVFKTFQDNNTDTSAAMEDITLLDVWVLTDWANAHIERYAFTKNIMRDLLKLAERDIWFANLLNISINALGDFPDFALDDKSRKDLLCEIGSSYKNVFGKINGYTITIGKTFSRLKDKMEKAWWIDTDINEYKNEIISCGRLIWSIIHLICAGYVNFETRVSENNYPYRSLKNLLKCDKRYKEQSGAVQEIHDP